MSSQCSNLFNYRSFNLFLPFHTPLKPYATTLRPVFLFHSNLVLFGRRSRNRTSSIPPPFAAQLSSEVVLVATTEHHDGSLLFRFGDASEVVKNDEVLEEIESISEEESNLLKVLDGDQKRQVVEKTIEGEYASDGGCLTEVVDETRNEDIDSDVAKWETNVTSDLTDYHAESIERLSDISEEEVLSLESDAKTDNSLEGVESTLDKTECTTQLDEDECLNLTISLLDNSSSRDESANFQGTVLKDSDDETEDQLVSVKLESIQASDVDVMDVKKPHAKDELHKVETEDASENNTEDLMPPATMGISTDELLDAANEDVNEELQDMNINGVIVIDEMLPPDQLGAEPLDEVNHEAVAEATIEVLSTKAMDVKDQSMENELQEMSLNKRDENDVADVMPESCVEEAEPILEEDISQTQSTPVELKPTIQVSDIELQDLDDDILQVIDEIEDPSEPLKLETMQVSNTEVMAVTQPDVEDELIKVETEDANAKDLMLPATIDIPDVELTEAANEDVEEGLQDMNINEDTLIDGMPPFNILGSEPTSDELQRVRTDNMQVSDTEVQVSKDQNLDDGILQLINEDAGESDIKDVERLLDQIEAQLVQDEGVNYNMLKQYAETDAPENSFLLSSSEVAKASEESAIPLATEAKVKREEIYLTGYFLSSGAALLELPFKALTGGDDAYFVASNKWVGVANGLSQWSFEGTDSGVYAQELMKTCEKIVLDTTTVPTTNPVQLLCRCVKETNMSGSSNILIANFDGQALHVANIGDTGFIIIRHGAIYKKSSPLLHEFHFALQVEDRDDPLELVEEYIIELEEGDIVVCATDGLFDNLYEPEIARVVSKLLKAGMKPEEVAKVLATRAQEVGRSVYVRSPFSDAAQAAGYTGYTGGKSDNVAVIVSLVEKRSNFFGK